MNHSLLIGTSGAGKATFLREIHAQSRAVATRQRWLRVGRLAFLAGVALAAGACAGPTAEQGLITTQGRGAVELSKHGDPLLQTGDSARKVSKDFAEGYAKSDIDSAHREYFERLRKNTGADHSEDEGRQTLYDVTLPERTDSGGIVRAPRPVIVSITE